MTTATHTPADDGAGAPPAATDRPDLSVPEPAEVFEPLFDQYARQLHRYLVQRVGAQAGDDLVAETFLTALQQRHSYDPDRAAVRSWLYGIATNLVRQHLRPQARALDADARVVATTRTDLETHEGRVVDRVDAQRRGCAGGCAPTSTRRRGRVMGGRAAMSEPRPARVRRVWTERELDAALAELGGEPGVNERAVGLARARLAAASRAAASTSASAAAHPLRQWQLGDEAAARKAGVRLDDGWPQGIWRAEGGRFVLPGPEDEVKLSRLSPAERAKVLANQARPVPPSWQNPTPEWLGGLPADPAALRERLLADVQAAGKRFTGAALDARALGAVADALRSGLVPAEVRATMYKALAGLASLQVTERQANLDGSRGIALGVDDGAIRHEIIIDSGNGQFIGERLVTTRAEGTVPAGTVSEFTSVTTEVVDSVPNDV